MMTTSFNQEKLDEFYYSLIESKGPNILLFGESTEQWTNLMLSFFNRNGIPICFFSWERATELRLQLEFVRYPVVQLWFNKKLEEELIGYREEELNKISKKFFKLKRT